jgi:hypothetical protein
MRFNTGTSSDTERMRITSGGNVGIGTSSFSDVAFGSPTLKVYGSRATLGLNSTGSLTTIAMVAASDTTKAIHINQESNGALKIYQYSAAAETFVLSAAGNLLVGTSTDSGFKLDVVGSGRFNGGATTDVLKIQSTGANADLWLYDSGTTAGNVRLRSVSNSLILISGGLSSLTLSSAGAATFYSSVSATSFFETSDKTVKTLIQDNVLIKGIEKVTAKTYLKNNKEEIGYFAQDLQGVLDSSINVGEKGLLSLSYTQVHTAKIAVAESEIDKLKKRVAELEQQLNLN